MDSKQERLARWKSNYIPTAKHLQKSKLGKYADEIIELRKQGYAFRQIVTYLALEHRLSISRQAVESFYNKHLKHKPITEAVTEEPKEPAPKQTTKEEPQKEEKQNETVEESQGKETTQASTNDILERFKLPTQREERYTRLRELYEEKLKQDEKSAIFAELKRIETKDEMYARMESLGQKTWGDTWNNISKKSK